ncbi:MAG: aspartate carbamoyltransferase [Campylobacteraceae bacterium 4484_166]|nr:MAG: aspartate carbamoyltransferase [Campylobacteraceae bacterium 4484_166]
MRHLITVDDFTNDEIDDLFKDATIFSSLQSCDMLQGKLVVTLFFENSTRTRSSFEIASKRLSAKVVNLDISTSSSSKGETIEDTIANLSAMKPDAIIIRHRNCGLPQSLTKYVKSPLINAGDGKNSHPTQALLDLYTIKEHFQNNIKNKKIAIVGDIKNSRVASSLLSLLPRFGIEPILVAPACFMPQTKFKTAKRLEDVIKDVDIVYSLRTQIERHEQSFYKTLDEFAKEYCVTKDIVKDYDILLMHPGPVNRNIDITDELLDDKRCKVLRQVTNGVAVRMAILKKLIKG